MAFHEPDRSLGPKRIFAAARNSIAGLRWALGEPAFVQELALVVLATPLALWLGHGRVERALLVGVLVLILVVEIANTAIERACDAVTAEENHNVRMAKDLGSLAVLMSFVLAAAVWALVLI